MSFSLPDVLPRVHRAAEDGFPPSLTAPAPLNPSDVRTLLAPRAA